jgi:hypothetical protein
MYKIMKDGVEIPQGAYKHLRVNKDGAVELLCIDYTDETEYWQPAPEYMADYWTTITDDPESLPKEVKVGSEILFIDSNYDKLVLHYAVGGYWFYVDGDNHYRFNIDNGVAWQPINPYRGGK